MKILGKVSMEKIYCQSCGMPMSDRDATYGKNANGTDNKDYCSYCYNHGKFTWDMTMDEMIEHCAPHMASAAGMTRDEARQIMKGFFPTLKRWKVAD